MYMDFMEYNNKFTYIATLEKVMLDVDIAARRVQI